MLLEWWNRNVLRDLPPQPAEAHFFDWMRDEFVEQRVLASQMDRGQLGDRSKRVKLITKARDAL